MPGSTDTIVLSPVTIDSRSVRMITVVRPDQRITVNGSSFSSSCVHFSLISPLSLGGRGVARQQVFIYVDLWIMLPGLLIRQQALQKP